MANFKEEYENFVFYGSWKTLLSGFDKETAKEILWEIVNIGVGEEIESDNPMIIAIIQGAVMPNIKSAKSRYATAIENGKKGGRPRKEINIEKALELESQGKTQAEIAEEFGVSKNTIGNRLREHKNQKPTQKPKTETNKNHDKDIDIDIDIDIDKDNDIEKENIGSCCSATTPAIPLAPQADGIKQGTKPVEQVEAVGADKVITINCSDMRDSYYHLYKYLAKYQPALASFVVNSVAFCRSNKERTDKAIEICNTYGYTIEFNDTAAGVANV